MNIENPLIQAAIEARNRAYAPYSNFLVGAGVQMRDGTIFVGANIENASLGLTVCAERHAVAAAVAAGAAVGELIRVAVVVDSETWVAPCGACRQVLMEFGENTVDVVLYNMRTHTEKSFNLGQLLPCAFDGSLLPDIAE